VRAKLIAWFNSHARTLPWRQSNDPYRIWISEIMLQQTQVATVIPYYERFLQSFPTVKDLASADEQQLLKHWEGLGYYRRARSMHQAARLIVEKYAGNFPSDYESVIALPGIGRYTAGAILSIANDQRFPILEGNTVRVFSRWIALESPPTQTDANRLLWRVAEAMLPKRRAAATGAGTFNQAAMELGALLCTPQNPSCTACPVKGLCRAHRHGLQAQIPGKVTNIRYESRDEFVLVISDSPGEPDSPEEHCSTPGEVTYLIRPLPQGGRWAGLWDFPRTSAESLDSVQTAAEQLSEAIGRPVSAGMHLKTFNHAVTKYRIKLHVHAAAMAGESDLSAPWRFATLTEMAKLPMSVTGRKITDFLASSRQASP